MIAFDAEQAYGTFALSASFTSDAGVTAIFGPSGSGKTTVLRLIAGLERPIRGRIAVRDRVLVDTQQGVFVPKHRRRVGLVFQDAQLFPHMTVGQNIRFGRWFAPKSAPDVPSGPVIDAIGIAGLLDRRPSRLSGGERQRVALARALLAAPDVLLMDEPLASLDETRKAEILTLIKRIGDEFGTPIIYVTHAFSEVSVLASHVVVLDRGRVVATGSPADLNGRLTGGMPLTGPIAFPST
jgi:molybdate transport system ATP-binding protein